MRSNERQDRHRGVSELARLHQDTQAARCSFPLTLLGPQADPVEGLVWMTKLTRDDASKRENNFWQSYRKVKRDFPWKDVEVVFLEIKQLLKLV